MTKIALFNSDTNRELREGLALGLGFILLNIVFGISIGFPLISFSSVAEKYGIVSILAPLAEELLLGVALLYLGHKLGIPFAINVFVINPLIFMGFHFAAYGASFAAANAAFIGAFIYRVMANYLITNQNRSLNIQLPVSGIVSHLIINTYLITKLTGFVVVGVV